MSVQGNVYLLHFDEPYQHARHYIGWSENIEERLEAHRCGRGARLMEVVSSAGIGFQLARTWRGDRHLERKLKKRHNASQLCPICRAAKQATLTTDSEAVAA